MFPAHSLKLCSAEIPGHKEEPLAPGLQSVLVSEVLGYKDNCSRFISFLCLQSFTNRGKGKEEEIYLVLYMHCFLNSQITLVSLVSF